MIRDRRKQQRIQQCNLVPNGNRCNLQQ